APADWDTTLSVALGLAEHPAPERQSLLWAQKASSEPSANTGRTPSTTCPSQPGPASSFLTSSLPPSHVRFDTPGSMPYHDPENLATLSQMALPFVLNRWLVCATTLANTSSWQAMKTSFIFC